MKNNRLGCLTGAGLIAALITVGLLAGSAFIWGGKMFSSGALNGQPGESIGGVTSHAQIFECKACHTAPWESGKMADRCVTCHTDIATSIFTVADLHGSINQLDPNIACYECHQEHGGASAPLTNFNGKTFPHEVLGYSLEGHRLTVRNEPFACSDCHGNDITSFGLDACQACHQDMDIAFTQKHVLSFGADCLACHDGVDRYGHDFNHDAFEFKLIGEHVQVTCTNCHPAARSVADLQNTPQDCYSCHRQDDEHAGRFGSDCAACHNSNDWDDASFSHDRTDFPLNGGHANLACEQCHQGGVYKETSSQCVSCHADPGFHLAVFGNDCASCHSTSSWLPARFDFPHPEPRAEEDGTGIYHGGATCRQCHPSTVNEATCDACHREGFDDDDD